MKHVSSFKRGLSKILRARRSREFKKAIVEVDRLLADWPDNPHLLTLRGELIQLGEDDGPPLEEGRRTLERAVVLDPESGDALTELGYYVWAIEDNAAEAIRHFGKAVTLIRRQLRAALLGQAEALAELDRRSEALACLLQAYWLESRNGEARAGNGNGREILERIEALPRA